MNRNEKIIVGSQIAFWGSIVGTFILTHLAQKSNLDSMPESEAGIGASILWVLLMVFIAIMTIPLTIYVLIIREKIKKLFLILGLTPICIVGLFIAFVCILSISS